jgi:hypothetical protein
MASQPRDSTSADLARVPRLCADFDAGRAARPLPPYAESIYFTLESDSIVGYAPSRVPIFASTERMEGKQ